MSIANENSKEERTLEDINQFIPSTDLTAQSNLALADLSNTLAPTLQLIPSLSYFVNKNQSEANKTEQELSNKIEAYLNNLEKFNKKSKKLRIMDKSEEDQIELQQDEQQQVEENDENTCTIKKSKSVLKKFNRGNLIRQLTHESERATSEPGGSDDENDETKKNTLANAKMLNNKFTHLFFFKSDCALANLSKQLVKNFNNFEFEDLPIQSYTTDEDRQKSAERSDQSEPENDEERSNSASADDTNDEDQPATNRSSRSRNKSRRSANRHIKSTRIIRIDISEVDVVFDDPKTTATKIEYLDDLFKENSITKFYAFKKTANLSSLYLATNIAVSISSIDSESSSEESKDIASIHFSGEQMSNIRRESVAQTQSILNNTNFVKLLDKKQEQIAEENEKKSLKKKFAAMKQATFDKIRSRSNSKKKKRAKSENNKDDEFTLHHIDLRDYDEEKKKEINDTQLDSFLESRIVSTRRNAITSRIDKYYRGAELITYMENLLRQEYIENFLL